MVRRGGRRVYLGPMDSSRCALIVVGFIRGRMVHLGALWVSSGSSGVVWFNGVRSGGHRVYSGWLCSFESALGVVGFILVAGFIGVRPGCRRDHIVSLRSLVCSLGVVGFIKCGWVHLGTLWGT